MLDLRAGDRRRLPPLDLFRLEADLRVALLVLDPADFRLEPDDFRRAEPARFLADEPPDFRALLRRRLVELLRADPLFRALELPLDDPLRELRRELLLEPLRDPLRDFLLEPPRDAAFLLPPLLFRPPVFRAELVPVRELVPLFRRPVELPPDDFLAAAMISAPR